jgi:hypothetical protein
MTETLARRRFTELKQRTEPIPDAELEEFWSTLEPATIDFMIGEWKGDDLVTGHRGNGFLGGRWFGYTFKSELDVQPVVCLDADGNKFSDVELMNGETAAICTSTWSAFSSGRFEIAFRAVIRLGQRPCAQSARPRCRGHLYADGLRPV